MSGYDFTSCTAMLSRKVTGSELLSAAAGLDRGRVGERLRAALAGLQELHFLREKQSDMVRRALRGERDEASGGTHAKTAETRSEEQRLEATLASLKQQLTRLRRQDVGLKTHLQQLDQQISELKLDVCKASTEHLESDSRPSSGFYELSDGGLGSLSNSCTSVYSECLSSSSQASLLPLSAGPSAPHTNGAHSQVDVSRRRSADESTAQPDVPRGLGVRLGSSGIRTTSVSSDRARQRPVSTGDLDRMIAPAFPHFKPAEVRASTLCNPALDLKYQSSLVSRNGTEVYRYPSPLHAVAIQSPIFSLNGDQCGSVAPEAHKKPSELGFSEDTLPKEDQPDGYIVKLLQRSSSKINIQNETGLEKRHILCTDTQGNRPVGARVQDTKYRLPCTAEAGSLQRKTENQVEVPGQKSVSQEQVNLACVRTEETAKMCHSQFPTNVQDHKLTAVMSTKGKVQEKASENFQSVHSDHGSKPVALVPKPPLRRPSFTSSNEENRSSDGGHTRAVPSEFVRAQFVPAGSQNVKVRQADKKTKAVKLRKKGNEKPPSKKHQQKPISREHEKDRVKPRRDKDMKQFGTERERGDGRLQEARLRSCSESSLLGPGNQYGTHLQLQPQQNHISKSTKHQKANSLDLEQTSVYQAKKKTSQKWPSASEIQLPPAVPHLYQRSKDMPNHRVSQKLCMTRSISLRPRSSHCGGLAHPIQPSRSSTYFGNSAFGYPPAPLHTRYPPRCESEFSEYSAECASLFHSTIAESSEGELSDYTANRFGDSESSQESRTTSDTDSSLSLDEEDLLEEDEEEGGGLVWAEAAMGPTAAGVPLQQHPRPEPSACRIKASRALKKKIRRFQPASLKVMTLV